MKFIIKQGKNQLYYYKEYNSGKLVRVSKETFDNYYKNKYPNKNTNKTNKYSGGAMPINHMVLNQQTQKIENNSFDPKTSYVVVGYENADTDNPIEIKIGIYPVFSLAKEALISWCNKLYKNQKLKDGKVGSYSMSGENEQFLSFEDYDYNDKISNGVEKYMIKLNSRKGKIYYMNNKNNIIERNREMFEYPSNYLFERTGLDLNYY